MSGRQPAAAPSAAARFKATGLRRRCNRAPSAEKRERVNYRRLKATASGFNERVTSLSTGVNSRRSGGTEPENVMCGIHIPIQDGATRGTRPFPVTQAQILVNKPARVTALGRGKETVNLEYPAAVPGALVLKLADKLRGCLKSSRYLSQPPHHKLNQGDSDPRFRRLA